MVALDYPELWTETSTHATCTNKLTIVQFSTDSTVSSNWDNVTSFYVNSVHTHTHTGIFYALAHCAC